MIIVEYNGWEDIIVEFVGYGEISRVKTTLQCWKKGKVKNRYYKSVCGVGYIGNATTSVNGKLKESFTVWSNMLHRCYDKKHKRYNLYGGAGVRVDERWLCFEYFEEDYNFMIKELDKNCKYQLDKDILSKNNIIYSKENCCLVPNGINILFTTYRGNGLPTGISMQGKRYYPANDTKTYKTLEEAFAVYKQNKEALIKEKAEFHYNKHQITEAVYEALINWEVEMTD